MNREHAAQAGLFTFFADHNKVNAGTLFGQGQLPTLENSMDHSGTLWGTDKLPGISTQDQQKTQVLQLLGSLLLYGLPMYLHRSHRRWSRVEEAAALLLVSEMGRLVC